MSSMCLSDCKFSELYLDRPSCADVGSVVATALAVAISAHQGRPVHAMLEGFHPSMKVAEVCALFPHTSDPIPLLHSIRDSVTNEVSCNSIVANDPFHSCSLLPTIRPCSSARETNADSSKKTYYRRLYFRGAFMNYPSLRHATDAFPISACKVALHYQNK